MTDRQAQELLEHMAAQNTLLGRIAVALESLDKKQNIVLINQETLVEMVSGQLTGGVSDDN